MAGSLPVFVARGLAVAAALAVVVSALTLLTLHGLHQEGFQDTHMDPRVRAGAA